MLHRSFHTLALWSTRLLLGTTDLALRCNAFVRRHGVRARCALLRANGCRAVAFVSCTAADPLFVCLAHSFTLALWRIVTAGAS